MSRRKSFPVTPVIAVAVAAFATWVYFSEYKGGEEREKHVAEASALLPFSNNTVMDVTVHTAQYDVVLKKEGAKEAPTWKVLKPYNDLGDTMAIDTFLATVSTEKTNETVVDKAQGAEIAWATYGLDKPSVEATLIAKTDTGEKKRVVQVGAVPAFDGSVYVRIDGEEKVMLMASTIRAALQKDPRDFRDKRFFPTTKHPDFKGLEISRVGFPKLNFVLKGETWVDGAAKPGSWPIDAGVVKSYIQSVEGLRGNDVWAENKTDAGVLHQRKLDKPGLVVNLTADTKAKGGYEVKVAAFAKEESVAAGTSSQRPLVFSVYKAQLELLSKTEDDFRDLKFPFQFKIADVRAIELERPKGEVSLPMLTKKDGKWALDPMDANFQGRELKADAVDHLMTDLNSLQAGKILPKLAPKPKSTDKGSLRVGIFGEKNKKLVELIFTPEGEKYRVSSTQTPDRVLEIEKAQFDSLTLDLATAPAKPATPPEPAAKTPSAAPAAEKGKP